MAKRLGVVPRRYSQPLVSSLSAGRSEAGLFELVEESAEKISHGLREGNLHGALLSPVDYTSLYSQLHILSGVGVVSLGESRSIDLVFKEGLRTFSKIAVDPACFSEIMLARLILSEKYETTPEIVPRKESVVQSLDTSDAVLIVDLDLPREDPDANRLDLIDEWYDITELPYVHALWGLRDEAFTAPERKSLRELSLVGTTELSPFTEEREYLESFRYELDEEGIAGLTEFLRMAYFYGFLNDLPDIKFAPAV